ncbi:hypothetical protein ACVGVM_01480 [Pseudonocardia bannensis]|uniref:Small secreted protein n=1 Tax=Pseudonocardia bannensis TaxID=630973 RepID=A0A848DDL2_9PSEU|nr:hypothetical protein [Pseudonocardia bannensis]NMH90663.1 hypothetical protein [Pseudonocardia bannensis]
MRLPRSVGAIGASLTVLLVAGCGGDAEAVTWSDQVCGAMVAFRDTVSSAAAKVTATDTPAKVQELADFTGNAVTAAQGAIADLDAVGDPPVEGGDTVVTTLKQRMTVVRTTFATAKSQIDVVDVGGPDAEAALRSAVAPLQNLTSLPDPAATLEANPDLREALSAAPRCRDLRQDGAGG